MIGNLTYGNMNLWVIVSIGLSLVLGLGTGCKKTPAPESQLHPAQALPVGFPEMQYPQGNEFTEARWKLGKKLFFDNILSIDSSINCGSCHKPHLAFSDDQAISLGVEGRLGTRNAPSLANVGYHPYLLREGGVPTLEMQVLVPIQEENEFDHNIVEIAKLLEQDETYVAMSKEAYDREPDHYVITRALGVFERTLISGNSAYDQYTFQGNKSALNDSEIRGMNLFFSSKTNCSSCHSGFNFTNYSFENNGLYEQYSDIGRMRVSGDPADESLFKVPSLRNVGVTPPYMHDGSVQTLEEVIEHYDQGGLNHPHKSNLIQPLNLTNQEKTDLIAFLHSLTDHSFIKNNIFHP